MKSSVNKCLKLPINSVEMRRLMCARDGCIRNAYIVDCVLECMYYIIAPLLRTIINCVV